MKRFIAMIAVLAIVLTTCAIPAFAIMIEHIDPETGEIIRVTTEEEGQANIQAGIEKSNQELQEWIASGANYTSAAQQEAFKNAFIEGDRTSAESYGYIGYTNDAHTSETYTIGKNAMFYLKDNVLVITGSGATTIQPIIYPTGMFSLNENIEVIIIGPGITNTSNIGANLPNLKAVITMDVNTRIKSCFHNNGLDFLPGYWENPSMTRRVILGAGLNFEEWDKHDYTYTFTIGTKPAYGRPTVITTPTNETVMIAPNYRPDDYQYYANPNVFLPDGLGYNELVAKAKELLAHGEYGQEFPKAMYDYLPVELGGTGKIKLEAGKFYLGENQAPIVNEPVTPVETETTNNISSWAETDVKNAESLGIVPDTLPVNYTQNITRENFCEIIAPLYEKLTGKTITETATFSDTNNSAVQKLAGLGIVGGTSADTFAPNNNLTRAEAAAIFARMGNKLGLSTSTVSTNFTDCANHWATSEIQTCYAMGLMSGTSENNFTPNGNLTIEQAIVIAMRAYDKIM